MKTVHIDIGLRKAFSTPGGNDRAGISYSNLPYPAEALPSDGLLRYFTRKIRGFATSGRYAVQLQANGGTA